MSIDVFSVDEATLRQRLPGSLLSLPGEPICAPDKSVSLSPRHQPRTYAAGAGADVTGVVASSKL